jgi:hypothetical protein
MSYADGPEAVTERKLLKQLDTAYTCVFNQKRDNKARAWVRVRLPALPVQLRRSQPLAVRGD